MSCDATKFATEKEKFLKKEEEEVIFMLLEHPFQITINIKKFS